MGQNTYEVLIWIFIPSNVYGSFHFPAYLFKTTDMLLRNNLTASQKNFYANYVLTMASQF